MDKNISKVYINREVSWLAFNKRVLEEANSIDNPIFERLRFWGIYNTNLDEFYMVRIGSLLDQTLLKNTIRDSKTNLTPKEQIDMVNNIQQKNGIIRDKVYWGIVDELKSYGVEHVKINTVSSKEEEFLERYFMSQVYPLLSPQIIDNHHPFPFLENKKLYIGVNLTGKGDVFKLGILPIDDFYKSVVFLTNTDEIRFVLVEELIYYFLDKVFKQRKIEDKIIFRITRNADINIDDDFVDMEIDYREVMKELLKERKKLAPVRLEIYSPDVENQPDLISQTNIIKYMMKMFELKENQIFIRTAPLVTKYISLLQGKISNKISNKSQMMFEPLESIYSSSMSKDASVIEEVRKRDLLLHYPFETMQPLIKLIKEASEDKNVISIKVTLYRVATNSKVINALVNAAERGIDVSVVVELRARFDEENNIEWSKTLEEAGCKVVYGIEGFKIHSKLLLITRKVNDKIEYISHIGTGNFNENTAKVYTDMSLLTSNESIGQEASMIFTSLFLGDFVNETEHLLVAPKCLKSRIVQYIDREIAYAKKGEDTEIILKMNSLTDKMLINKLIEASQAGVKIKMIIRGICCLQTGVEGYTENIKVISIVGRFLEHSRVYIFGKGERSKVYISSADFMTRNTEKRVEVAVPIYDYKNKERVLKWIEVMLSDNVKARIQTENGEYNYIDSSDQKINSQIKIGKLITYEEEMRKVIDEDRLKSRGSGWIKTFFKSHMVPRVKKINI